jgi:hypothetical protein
MVKYNEALKTIPLSNFTAMPCTESVSEDVKKQLLTCIKCSPKFSLQINKQINRCCRISLATYDCKMLFQRRHLEKFMFCLVLSERCTGNDIFKAVNEYFTAKDISRANCNNICTNRATALTIYKKGYQVEVQQIIPPPPPHINFIIVSFIDRLQHHVILNQNFILCYNKQ